MKEWIYFGCHGGPGHYLFTKGMRRFTRYGWPEKLHHFDGLLPPQTDTAGYIATMSRLEGWGLSALAFWDYSVDKRGGCNSIVFAPSLTITPDELLGEAQARFPEVFGRLPQPVRLHTPSGVALPRTAQPRVEAFVAATEAAQARGRCVSGCAKHKDGGKLCDAECQREQQKVGA